MTFYRHIFTFCSTVSKLGNEAEDEMSAKVNLKSVFYILLPINWPWKCKNVKMHIQN